MDGPTNWFALSASRHATATLSRGDRSGWLTLLLPTDLDAVGLDENRQPDGSDHSTADPRWSGRSDLLHAGDMASHLGGQQSDDQE
jgi:hypothetical protein